MGCSLSRAEPESNRKRLNSGNRKDYDGGPSKHPCTKQIIKHIMSAGLNKIATAAQKAEEPSVFPWTDLPAEIKNRIYDFTLSSSTPIHIKSREQFLAKPYSNYNKRSRFQYFVDEESNGRFRIFSKNAMLVPNLLLVHKQTYREGAPILYHNNLRFLDSIAFNVFMFRHEDRKSLKWLKRITLESLLDTSTGCYLLGCCVENLQRVTINNLPGYCDTAGAATHLFYGTAIRLWLVEGREEIRYARVDLIRLSESSVRSILTVENGLEPNEIEVTSAHQEVEENLRMVMKSFIKDQHREFLQDFRRRYG